MIGVYVGLGLLALIGFAVAADVAEIKRAVVRLAAVAEREERRHFTAPDYPPAP